MATKTETIQDLKSESLTPRSTAFLLGHTKEEQEFFDCFKSGNFHHSWLITGPKGIGKAIQKISLSTTGEDEKQLLEFSDKVKDYNKQRIETKLDSFLQNQETCSLVFADNIKTINTLFNNELEILFDEENLYIASI